MHPFLRCSIVTTTNTRRTCTSNILRLKSGIRALSSSHTTRRKVQDEEEGCSGRSDKESREHNDRGYLAFTKTSLYKLTLPLAPPSPRPSSSSSDDSSSLQVPDESKASASPSEPGPPYHGKEDSTSPTSWEQGVEEHEHKKEMKSELTPSNSHDPYLDNTEDTRQPHPIEKDSASPPAEVHSVVFLLHSSQPLSYIESLMRAEPFRLSPDPDVSALSSNPTPRHYADAVNAQDTNSIDTIPVSFHSELNDRKRWSPSTGIGDFLRDAARKGSFIIRLGPVSHRSKNSRATPNSSTEDAPSRIICVNVPSFEERTQFLRRELYLVTSEIERLSVIKSGCDAEAKVKTQRVAISGAGILGMWWVTVGYLTFQTDLGWDTMEPITYLTGLGTVISGYLWFLWHNREVSYRTVLTESTSRQQRKLYLERQFDAERYNELIDEARGLRRAIKKVASEYDLSWEQGETKEGKRVGNALRIVRREEDRRDGRLKREKDEDGGGRGQEDNDADGEPDGRTR